MTAKIPGIIISMGGEDFVVPPLNLGQLRRLMPQVRQLTEIGSSMDEAQIDALLQIVTAALQRNYPETTIDQVEGLIDLGNARDVLTAILTGSGLRTRGEAQAKSSTGPTSTGSSLMPADLAPEPSTN
jgi:hypothetical protein